MPLNCFYWFLMLKKSAYQLDGLVAIDPLLVLASHWIKWPVGTWEVPCKSTAEFKEKQGRPPPLELVLKFQDKLWAYPNCFLDRENPHYKKEKQEKRKGKEKLQGKSSYRMKGEDMEDVMMMMISSTGNPRNETIPQEPINTATCPSWKLYDNPFYYSDHHHQPHHQQQQCQSSKHVHQVNLPVSARKIAASFWDFTFFKPVMHSELDIARAQIIDLKAELEYECKARKKAESLNKKLAKELAEERRGREALERVCEELAREISLNKAEIDRMKREFEEERKMLRMAEVLREERVQMKLSEAKILFEEKLLELEETKRRQPDTSVSRNDQKNKEDKLPAFTANLSGKFSKLVFNEKSCDNSNTAVDSSESTRFALSENSSSCYENINSTVSSSMAIQRKASPEPENPHIKRGIKGFVEFPRVVRAIGSKSRHWGTKLECQKSQLRILLKQKSPIRSNSLVMS